MDKMRTFCNHRTYSESSDPKTKAVTANDRGRKEEHGHMKLDIYR